MKYRMISASALPLALCIAGNAVAFRKLGDSVEVELSPRAAQRIARHGAVRFEAIAEPVREPASDSAPEPAQEPPAAEHAEPMPFTYADLTPIATEPPPPADTGAATE
jgi:hypothetical protein